MTAIGHVVPIANAQGSYFRVLVEVFANVFLFMYVCLCVLHITGISATTKKKKKEMCVSITALLCTLNWSKQGCCLFTRNLFFSSVICVEFVQIIFKYLIVSDIFRYVTNVSLRLKSVAII